MVPALLQHQRGRAVRLLPRRPARLHAAVRRRGAARHRRRRAHPRVHGPVPRAPGRDLAHRGHRPRAAPDQGAPAPGRRRGRHRGDPRDQSQHRGRGHRHVPGPAPQAARDARSPASPAASRWAATSSTPTRSRSAVRSKAAERSTPDGRGIRPFGHPNVASLLHGCPRAGREGRHRHHDATPRHAPIPPSTRWLSRSRWSFDRGYDVAALAAARQLAAGDPAHASCCGSSGIVLGILWFISFFTVLFTKKNPFVAFQTMILRY